MKYFPIIILLLAAQSSFAEDYDAQYTAGYNNIYATPGVQSAPYEEGVRDSMDDENQEAQESQARLKELWEYQDGQHDKEITQP
jgi:hypothetical protein